MDSPNLLVWWSPALAFAAGVVSFASPCVLPLVPGYLSFISGVQSREERRPLVPMLLFVLGFALVFTTLGVASRSVTQALRSVTGQRVAGGLVLAVGLLMVLYAFRLGGAVLYAERRPFLARVRPGTTGALPLGMAFAAGWTPCLGPVLTAMFALSAGQGGGIWGGLLFLFYSLGLGLPFVLIGMGVRRLTTALGFVRRNYHWFAGVGGGLLVVIGILLVTNQWLALLSRLGVLRWVGGFEPPL